MLDALWNGLVLGVGFNSLTSFVGSIAAAMLLAREPGRLRWMLAVLVLGGAWFVGDGVNLVQYAQGAPVLSAAEWLGMLLWALVGFGVGYLLPTWAGVFVGRRVTWGTGWASAGVTAAMVSGMLSVLSTRLGG